MKLKRVDFTTLKVLSEVEAGKKLKSPPVTDLPGRQGARYRKRFSN